MPKDDKSRKVLVFGTFDGLHEGHRHFLNQAMAHGAVRIIVARDETVNFTKGRPALKDETARLKALVSEGYDAILGGAGDKYTVIEDYHPDIICLGYDQVAFIDKLKSALEARNIGAEIMRLDSYMPEKYKSSILNEHPHDASSAILNADLTNDSQS